MTLETPLSGRFVRERYLAFGPSNAYLFLVFGCVLLGFAMVVYGKFTTAYWMFVGLMVFFAGIWGALCLKWIAFDLRACTYTRRDGTSAATRFLRGGIEEIEALFVLSEERPSLGQILPGRSVTYRIVVQWRGLRVPSMILEQDYRAVPPGVPINFAVGPSLQRAQAYGKALRVPVVDHSHANTHNPIPTA